MFTSLKKLVGGLKNESSPVSVTALRFLQLFEDHGVAPAQIPRLLPGVPLASLHNTESLLAALTPAILDRAANFFGVRTQWLEGVDERIYEPLYTYKEPRRLLEHLSALVKGKEIGLTFPIRVLTTSKQLDHKSREVVYLAPVLVEQIADLGDETINRFHVYQDGFDWSHTPSRIELKAIARIAFIKLNSPVSLFVISEKEMDAVLEGRMIPHRFLDGGLISTPSLEDFAISKEKYPVAKECDELPHVLRYIETNKLHEIPFELAQRLALEDIESVERKADDCGDNPAVGDPSPPFEALGFPATEIGAQTGVSGKRADNTRVRWEPVRILVKAWLVENGNTVSITDAIQRIHQLHHLPASQLSDSAIRKRIADLWPLEARKSGRKPKKSP